MKRIILVSMYITTSIVMFSCTNDPVAPKDNKTTVVASEQDSDPNTSNPPIKP